VERQNQKRQTGRGGENIRRERRSRRCGWLRLGTEMGWRLWLAHDIRESWKKEEGEKETDAGTGTKAKAT
jgi:hypothetical protein